VASVGTGGNAPSGGLSITGLPFTCGTGKDSSVNVRSTNLITVATTSIQGYIAAGANIIVLEKFAAGVAANMATDMQINSEFVISSIYLTD
jgi:hypothetical protein